MATLSVTAIPWRKSASRKRSVRGLVDALVPDNCLKLKKSAETAVAPTFRDHEINYGRK